MRESSTRERIGVAAAIGASALGGSAIATTRLLATAIDPVTFSAVRFAFGLALLLPAALYVGSRWPRRADWPGAILLGILSFVLFGLMFAWAMQYTTAARGGLAFSTMPLQTMIVAAVLGVERLSLRKTVGVLVAMAGVAFALMSDLAAAPQGAWRGDLIMVGAVFCMSFYVVLSRPFIARSDSLAFTTACMIVGEIFLVPMSFGFGNFGALATFGWAQWLAIAYVGVVGGAIMFLMWVFAIGRTTPTQAAVSVTVNPVVASIAGALMLGEAIAPTLVIGLVAVLAGIWIATTQAGKAR
jgi:drug/metabolite transporter (DMT)-like permease